MSLSKLETLIEQFLQLHEWDSGAERLIHKTTIQILLAFLFLLSSNLIFGESITCLSLPETPEGSIPYFHDYCYYQDKLRVISQSSVKRVLNQGTMTVNAQNRDEVAVSYYQWVPFIISIQVAMCILPAALWQFIGLHYFYGSDFAAIMRQLFPEKDKDIMEKSLTCSKIAARDAFRWMEHKKKDRFGMHATMTIYVFIKWLTFLSLLLQFYMIAKIYASGALLWGVHMSYELLNGVYKNAFNGVFPQIVGCKLHRHQMGDIVNEFYMRCLLPQNFMNSKVFLFLYWWYLVAMTVAFLSAFRYTFMMFVPSYQRYSTKALLPTQEFFLEMAGREQHSVVPANSDPLEYFVDYLGNDGYLLLQCSSVALSVVSIRYFVNNLYDVVVIKGGIEEPCSKVKKLTKSPAPGIEFDGGGDRKHCGKESLSERKSKKSQSTDEFLEPLLTYHTSPSCSSSSQHDRYTSAPGKILPDDG